MKVKNLTPAPYNPRKISDKKLEMLGKSMIEYGDLSGIVYNRRTNRLVGGNQRYKHLDPSWDIDKVAHTDDVGTVAVGHVNGPHGRWAYREVDWDEKRELAANIAANKHGGEWDIPLLKDMFTEIDNGEFDIELTGFEKDELKEMFDYEIEEPAGLQYESKYEVAVDCDSEDMQKDVYDLLTKKGYKCRVLIL